MSTSSSTVFFMYPFLDPFLPVDTLFLLPTVNRNSHLYIYIRHGPWRSRTATSCHSTTPPETSRPILAIARQSEPVRTFRTFLPVRQVTCVTRNHICFSLRPIWRGAAVISPKGKKTKQGRGKHLFAPRNATTGIGAATILRCIICFCPLFCLPGRKCS